MSFFETLGIDEYGDERDIKRAYAKLIKEFRPDTHPIEFARIREAYEGALNHYKWQQKWQAEEAQYEANEENNSSNAIEFSVSPTAMAAAVNVDADLAENLTTTEKPAEILTNTSAEKPVEAPPVAIISPPFNSPPTSTPQPARNLAQEIIYALDNCAIKLDETGADAATNKLLSELDDTSLDEKAELEYQLLNWFLYAITPMLLAFKKLNERFNWSKNMLAFGIDFEQWQIDRLVALHSLAVIYTQDIAQQKQGVAKHKVFSLLMTSEHFNSQQNAANTWQILCEKYEINALKNHPNFQLSKFQVVWADLIFGAFIGVLLWFLTVGYSDSHRFYAAASWTIFGAICTAFLAEPFAQFLQACDRFKMYFDDKEARLRALIKSKSAAYGTYFFLAVLGSIAIAYVSHYSAEAWGINITKNLGLDDDFMLIIIVIGLGLLVPVLASLGVILLSLPPVFLLVITVPMYCVKLIYIFAQFIEDKVIKVFKLFGSVFLGLKRLLKPS
jgi:hypothetical protein